MNIVKNTVVSMDYTLTNEQGEILDSSVDSKPLEFLCGHDHIIAGLEKALVGKKTGDKIKVKLTPQEGYGEYDAKLVHTVGKNEIETEEEIEEGTCFQMDTADGPVIYTVTGIDGDEIILDGNHPLAGQTLKFDVEIKGVREAAADELEHGHIHGAGCDH